jgi:hypothetical protein
MYPHDATTIIMCHGQADTGGDVSDDLFDQHPKGKGEGEEELHDRTKPAWYNR